MWFPLFTVSAEYILSTLLGLIGLGSPGDIDFMKQVNAIDYGIKVEVDGHNMSVNIMGEQHNQTIVFLPGQGMYSPYYIYKSFNEPLSEDFKVVTVEPFGYGLSDGTEKERTNENIVNELHTCLEKLGIDQYYLMAHSLGGIYSLAYAEKYPEEVLGFIGLENTPSGAEDHVQSLTPEIEMKYEINRVLAKHHIGRLLDDEYKYNNTIALLDPCYDYSEEELKNLELLFGSVGVTENIINEAELLRDNIADVHDIVFNCPAIMFLASDNTNRDDIPWKSLHEAMIGYPEKSEIVVLKGSHMIHIDQDVEILKRIKKWIQKLNLENN